MLVGLDTNSYRLATGLYEYTPKHPIGLQDLLAKAEEFNLAGLHIANHSLLRSTDESYLGQVRQKAEEQGLYLELGVHGTDVELLREAVRTAAVLGSETLRTFVGADRQRGWAEWRQQLDRATDNLKQIVPLVEDNGIRLAVENHGDLTSAEIVNLLDKVGSESIGVCLDTGKSLLVVEDPLLAAHNLAPYVITVSLTDYQLVSAPRGVLIVGCALGQGAVDLLAIVKILQQRTPDLHLNVESPVVRWELPFLEDKFWDAFYDRTPRDLVALLRLIRKNAMDPKADYRTPVEREEPEEQVLKHEEDMLRRSVLYAKEVLLAG
ncbi:MAG: sugar phosphate isomerase/epimerase family protein [Chloroflexota bacterium]